MQIGILKYNLLSHLKDYLFIVIIILLIGIFLLSIRIRLLQEQLNDQKITSAVIENKLALQSDFSGYYKFRKNYPIRDSDGTNYSLSEIIKEPMLVLYVDRLNCTDCIIHLIKDIQLRMQKELDGLDIAIFAGNFKSRELNALIRSNTTAIQYYSIGTETSDFLRRMQKANKPYFFTINAECEVSNIYFPFESKQLSRLNDTYFTSIIRKFLNETNDKNKPVHELVAINPTVNLEEIRMKKTYSITIQIKNIGNQILNLNSINTNCRCMKLAMDLSPLKPDSLRSIYVDVFFTRKGPFSKTITVESDLKEASPLVITIYGTVE